MIETILLPLDLGFLVSRNPLVIASAEADFPPGNISPKHKRTTLYDPPDRISDLTGSDLLSNYLPPAFVDLARKNSKPA